jgi:hypothetical protein
MHKLIVMQLPSRNYSNPLLHNRDYYVTMEMQYNLLLHNMNRYITMEMPSRPNISQYVYCVDVNWTSGLALVRRFQLSHDNWIYIYRLWTG